VVAELVRDRQRLDRMRLKARQYAMGCSWDAVFDRVYAGYETGLPVRGVKDRELAQTGFKDALRD